jgi:hypothetical protein
VWTIFYSDHVNVFRADVVGVRGVVILIVPAGVPALHPDEVIDAPALEVLEHMHPHLPVPVRVSRPPERPIVVVMRGMDRAPEHDHPVILQIAQSGNDLIQGGHIIGIE